MTLKAANAGTYTLTYYSSDGLYHSSPVVPPSQVAGLVVSSVTYNSVALSWAAATQGTNAVTGYYVFRNGTQIAAQAATTYTDTGLASPVTYTYTVSAYDSAGTIGVASASVSGTTTFSITTTSLPSTTQGVAYSQVLQAQGGIAPLSWRLGAATGTNSWSVSSSGVLTGTPANAETDQLTFQVTDSASNSRNVTLGVTVTAAVTGGLTHGSQYTVTGSGFGTRPNYNYFNFTWKGVRHMHWCWCDFSTLNGNVNASPATYDYQGWATLLQAPIFPRTNSGAAVTAPTGKPTVVSTAQDANGQYPQLGGPSQSGAFWTVGQVGYTTAWDTGIGVHRSLPVGFVYTQEYSCFKYKHTGTASLGRDKMFRMLYDFGHLVPGDTVNQDWVHIFNISGLNQTAKSAIMAIENNNSAVNWYLRPPATLADGNVWNKYEHRLDTSLYCSINGSIANWTNGTTTTSNGNLPLGFTNPPVATGGLYYDQSSSQNYMFFIGAQAASTPDNTVTHNAADIYHDWTWARVEITDGTHSEIQILSSWADTAIGYVFNKGELASGACTLNVIDSTNAVIFSTSVTVN